MHNLETSGVSECTLESSFDVSISDLNDEDISVINITSQQDLDSSKANVDQRNVEEESAVAEAFSDQAKEESFIGGGDAILSPNAKKFLEKVGIYMIIYLGHLIIIYLGHTI